MIVLIIIIIVITIILISSNNNKDVNENVDGNVGNDVNGDMSESESSEENKEKFLALGDQAFIDKQGDISGSRILTNGLLNQPYEDIKKSIQEGKPLDDASTLGVGKGDSFENAYNSWKDIQDIQEKEPVGVRSQKEMSDIAKQISSTQNNSESNIYTRAGSDKRKIVLEPLGTVGVCADYTTPERDRNHKIYSVAHAVHVPGFKMDTNRINQEFTESPGWSKNFSMNDADKVVATANNNASGEQSVVQPESFNSFISYY